MIGIGLLLRTVDFRITLYLRMCECVVQNCCEWLNSIVSLFQVLRILYHRTRKFSDVDIYFTLLTVMVLHHFPDRIDLILSFVTDLKDAEVRRRTNFSHLICDFVNESLNV